MGNEKPYTGLGGGQACGSSSVYITSLVATREGKSPGDGGGE